MRTLIVDTLPPADDRLYEARPVRSGLAGRRACRDSLRRQRPGVGAVAAAGCTRPPPPAPQLVELRTRYLGTWTTSSDELLEHDITPRALHHELSRTLRRFAADAGTAGATSMSAERRSTPPDRPRRHRRSDVRAPQFERAAGERSGDALAHRQGGRRRVAKYAARRHAGAVS